MSELEPTRRLIIQAIRPGSSTFYIGVPGTDPGIRVIGIRPVTRCLGFWPKEILTRGIVYRDVAGDDQEVIEDAKLRLVVGISDQD